MSIDLEHNEYDYSLKECKYDYTVGGATSSNTTVNCNENQTINFTAYGSYNFNYYVLDEAGNIETISVDFSIQTGGVVVVVEGAGGGGCPKGMVFYKNRCVNETLFKLELDVFPKMIDSIIFYRPTISSGIVKLPKIKTNKDIEVVSIEKNKQIFDVTILDNNTLMVTSKPLITDELFVHRETILKIKDIFGVTTYVPVRYRLINLNAKIIGIEAWIWMLFIIVSLIIFYIKKEFFMKYLSKVTSKINIKWIKKT